MNNGPVSPWGYPPAVPGAISDVRSPTRTSTEVRSPTRTSTEVRSPTSTSTEVRSPTSTSTEAYTADNFTVTVTGGAGNGANTTVNIYPVYLDRKSQSANGKPYFPAHATPPPHTIKEMLHEVMATPPPTGVMRGMMHEAMAPAWPDHILQSGAKQQESVALASVFGGGVGALLAVVLGWSVIPWVVGGALLGLTTLALRDETHLLEEGS